MPEREMSTVMKTCLEFEEILGSDYWILDDYESESSEMIKL